MNWTMLTTGEKFRLHSERDGESWRDFQQKGM